MQNSLFKLTALAGVVGIGFLAVLQAQKGLKPVADDPVAAVVDAHENASQDLETVSLGDESQPVDGQVPFNDDPFGNEVASAKPRNVNPLNFERKRRSSPANDDPFSGSPAQTDEPAESNDSPFGNETAGAPPQRRFNGSAGRTPPTRGLDFRAEPEAEAMETGSNEPAFNTAAEPSDDPFGDAPARSPTLRGNARTAEVEQTTPRLAAAEREPELLIPGANSEPNERSEPTPVDEQPAPRGLNAPASRSIQRTSGEDESPLFGDDFPSQPTPRSTPAARRTSPPALTAPSNEPSLTPPANSTLEPIAEPRTLPRSNREPGDLNSPSFGDFDEDAKPSLTAPAARRTEPQPRRTASEDPEVSDDPFGGAPPARPAAASDADAGYRRTREPKASEPTEEPSPSNDRPMLRSPLDNPPLDDRPARTPIREETPDDRFGSTDRSEPGSIDRNRPENTPVERAPNRPSLDIPLDGAFPGSDDPKRATTDETPKPRQTTPRLRSSEPLNDPLEDPRPMPRRRDLEPSRAEPSESPAMRRNLDPDDPFNGGELGRDRLPPDPVPEPNSPRDPEPRTDPAPRSTPEPSARPELDPLERNPVAREPLNRDPLDRGNREPLDKPLRDRTPPERSVPDRNEPSRESSPRDDRDTRPSNPDRPDLVGDGTLDGSTPKGAQRPQLKIEKQAPPNAVLGQPMVYNILVKNIGDTAAHDVIVEDRIPKGAEMSGSIPRAELVDKTLVWKLGTMQPGEEKKIAVRVTPLAEGQIGSITTVNFVAEVGARTVITAPKLQFDMTAPASARAGESVPLTFRLRNTGSAEAKNVVIRNIVPEGLRHADGNDLEYEIGVIPAGQTREVKLSLSAVKPGDVTNRAIATAAGGLSTESSARIEVLGPALSISRTGPKRAYLGRQVQYVTTVKNESERTIDGATVVETIPAGMDYVEALPAGNVSPDRRTISWRIDRLGSGQDVELKVKYLAKSAGVKTGRVNVLESGSTTASVTAETEVVGAANLATSISTGGGPLGVGDKATYRVMIRNRGNEAATNVRVRLALPDAVEFVASDNRGVPSADGREIQFPAVNRLEAGRDLSFQVVLKAARTGDVRLELLTDADDMQRPLAQEEQVVILPGE